MKKAKKVAVVPMGMLPLAKGLPTNIAASIGRTIARFNFLENAQTQILHWLAGIGVKQGRLTIRLPPARMYSNLVRDLLHSHRVQTDYPFRAVYKKLEAAEKARNCFAHSLYLKDPVTGKIVIQLVRGSWEFGQNVETLSRAVDPEGVTIDRAFLSEKRKAIEDAIKEIMKLAMFIRRALHTLNERRQTIAALDRRRPRQTG